jgi:CubicO group peptidase (beta-lactamase class C family)
LTVEDLGSLVEAWPVATAVAGVTGTGSTLGVAGDPERVMPIASVGKLLVGMAALVAIEEGTIELDEPAGPPGSTVRHLLAHASGLDFATNRVLSPPGRRRIYSNTGIEAFAGHLAGKAEMSFEEYLRTGVLDPLEMRSTTLRGSPAGGMLSTVADMLRFCRELLSPRLVSPSTLAEAVTPHFPELAGVLPDLGRFDPNPWGLTFEVRDGKKPHWTGTLNSPGTFGHFGGTGSFLWVDPSARLGAVAMTDRQFGPWAIESWPAFSDAVLSRYGSDG